MIRLQRWWLRQKLGLQLGLYSKEIHWLRENGDGSWVIQFRGYKFTLGARSVEKIRHELERSRGR